MLFGHFEKTFVLQKKLSFWPSEVALPFPYDPRALQWSGTQFLSWCLVCLAGSERFASARFQLRSRRQRGLDVYLSIWVGGSGIKKTFFIPLPPNLSELCLAWKAWKFVSDLENLSCHAGSSTLCGLALCTHSSSWLLFETIFGKLFSVPRNFGFFFLPVYILQGWPDS